jgi:phosphoserine phosphatase
MAMEKRPIVVGLDGILWSGQGLLRNTYVQMINEGLVKGTVNEIDKDSNRQLQNIGRAVAGLTVERIRPIANAASMKSIERVNNKVIEHLEEFSKEDYEFFALSSAPEFTVRAALRNLKQETGVSFSHAHVLSTHYETRKESYTGQYERLHKHRAVATLLEALDFKYVEVGIINGVTDLGWSNKLCLVTETVNPGNGLIKRVSKDSLETIQRSRSGEVVPLDIMNHE